MAEPEPHHQQEELEYRHLRAVPMKALENLEGFFNIPPDIADEFRNLIAATTDNFAESLRIKDDSILKLRSRIALLLSQLGDTEATNAQKLKDLYNDMAEQTKIEAQTHHEESKTLVEAQSSGVNAAQKYLTDLENLRRVYTDAEKEIAFIKKEKNNLEKQVASLGNNLCKIQKENRALQEELDHQPSNFDDWEQNSEPTAPFIDPDELHAQIQDFRQRQQVLTQREQSLRRSQEELEKQRSFNNKRDNAWQRIQQELQRRIHNLENSEQLLKIRENNIKKREEDLLDLCQLLQEIEGIDSVPRNPPGDPSCEFQHTKNQLFNKNNK